MHLIKNTLLLFTCLSISYVSYCQQVDYLEIRKSKYLADCGVDSQAVYKAMAMLQAIDQKKIDRNIDIYYHDLGMIYYKMSLITRNRKYMNNAVTYYKKALAINGRNRIAMWDCAVALVFSKHCKEGMKYIDAYIKIAPSIEIDTVAINEMRAICHSRN